MPVSPYHHFLGVDERQCVQGCLLDNPEAKYALNQVISTTADISSLITMKMII